ncbi:BQ5605_C012g06735 [Microbotryum silenes-dioicae]|uniref:BQ5605_C012g06735 protein n=1 Tax=Microbotryum silenes-dioicae TaxID=796604 RepID=A0A2X0LRU4_9BASI|nr:BQ5605_C012g06735 [Microbotryum silenes-dioicae]
MPQCGEQSFFACACVAVLLGRVGCWWVVLCRPEEACSDSAAAFTARALEQWSRETRAIDSAEEMRLQDLTATDISRRCRLLGGDADVGVMARRGSRVERRCRAPNREPGRSSLHQSTRSRRTKKQ